MHSLLNETLNNSHSTWVVITYQAKGIILNRTAEIGMGMWMGEAKRWDLKTGGEFHRQWRITWDVSTVTISLYLGITEHGMKKRYGWHSETAWEQARKERTKEKSKHGFSLSPYIMHLNFHIDCCGFRSFRLLIFLMIGFVKQSEPDKQFLGLMSLHKCICKNTYSNICMLSHGDPLVAWTSKELTQSWQT